MTLQQFLYNPADSLMVNWHQHQHEHQWKSKTILANLQIICKWVGNNFCTESQITTSMILASPPPPIPVNYHHHQHHYDHHAHPWRPTWRAAGESAITSAASLKDRLALCSPSAAITCMYGISSLWSSDWWRWWSPSWRWYYDEGGAPGIWSDRIFVSGSPFYAICDRMCVWHNWFSVAALLCNVQPTTIIFSPEKWVFHHIDQILEKPEAHPILRVQFGQRRCRRN